MKNEQTHVPPRTPKTCPGCDDPIGADCFHYGRLWHFDCWMDFQLEYAHYLDSCEAEERANAAANELAREMLGQKSSSETVQTVQN